MYWKIATLPSDLRETLAKVSREGPAATGRTGVRISREQKRTLVIFAAVATVAAAGLFATAAAAAGGGRNLAPMLIFTALGLLTTVWAACLWTERFRIGRSRVLRFLLVTPRVLVDADYDHGDLQAFRLREATDLKKLDTYGQNQSYDGRVYTVTFPGDAFSFTVAPGDVPSVEAALEQARSGVPDPPAGNAGLYSEDLVPTVPGTARSGSRRWFSDPFGLFWICAGGILCLLFVVVAVLARIFGK